MIVKLWSHQPKIGSKSQYFQLLEHAVLDRDSTLLQLGLQDRQVGRVGSQPKPGPGSYKLNEGSPLPRKLIIR